MLLESERLTRFNDEENGLEIVLHLGAHKTATTYIQELLSANEDQLRQHGIAFVSPSKYRPAIAEAFARDRTFGWVEAVRQRRRRNAIAAMVERANANGNRRLILSEENLIGFLDRVRSGGWLYDNVAAKLDGTIKSLGNQPVRLLLAVRDYADFFPSAYVEVLRMRGFSPFDDAMRARILNQTRGWPEVVDDIASAIPNGSEIVVWQYEAMANQERLIMEQFVGRELASALRHIAHRPKQGATQRAVEHLHLLAARGIRPSRRRVRKVLNATSKKKGYAGLDPWTTEQRRLLSQRYSHDLRRLVELRPNVLVHTPICPVGQVMDVPSTEPEPV